MNSTKVTFALHLLSDLDTVIAKSNITAIKPGVTTQYVVTIPNVPSGANSTFLQYHFKNSSWPKVGTECKVH